MGEPLTMSAEREAEIRGGHSLPLHTAIGWLLKELDEERAAHKRTQAVQDRISKWADATFGPATAEVPFRRFDEEDAEFTLENQDPEEAADIVICLFRWAAVKGVDLLAETEKKLAKCMARDWDLNGDGTGHRKGAATKQVLGHREQLRHSKEVCARWNRAASEYACGSEFIDDPERVFAHIKRSLELRIAIRTKKSQEVSKALLERLNNLCVAADSCCGATNRLLGILVTQAKEGHYPSELIGEGWQFAVDARDALRAAIALAERPEDLASSANTLASSDGSPADAVPSMKGTDGR